MKKALTIGMLLSSAVPVFAADPVVPDPISAPPVYQAPPIWTGLYIGGQIGWARGQSAPHVPVRSTPTPVDPSTPIEPEIPVNPSCSLGDFAWATASTKNTKAVAFADPCEAWATGSTPNTSAGVSVTQDTVETLSADQPPSLSSDSFNARSMAAAGESTQADVITYSSGGRRDTFIGGVHIGYNHQFENKLVLGAVADINFLKWDRFVDARYQAHSLEMRQSLDYIGTIRAKFGYAVDRLLVFGTGGLAYGGVENEFSIDGSSVETKRNVRFGYSIGAGLDYKAFENVSIGAEYLFTDLGKKSNNEVFKDNVSFHSVFLKASYHFN
ncbi:outer membrane beta-barrel protein [Brucella sp. NBRC 12950]|uniref:outer membrane protein n=1 Tax=Brucella sp. NBRC 12950 TaxID=2994518 RepID=UPI0024A19C2D|nr:outer membrane beta-barrel protein [Brucella sp. NBRC 12950]GLU29717.1 hypothetical protein Brsp01_49500 [Brucella sp. NBRC 12950]